MFKKILIANRGEIACRIIKTARRMGIATVAVYSDADAKALHVRMADEAIHIGGAASRESYLRGEVVIQAALLTGAEAVHPGYGFLSENEDFARHCAQAGLVFIGPSPEAINAMGLKDRAKAIMAKAGVPVVPGYQGERQEPDFLRRESDKIGYPVLIKAVAGGGGKGMRLVERGEDFAEALASCQREAQASFGNARVLIEKYITRPRHVEVQVFGDSHGNAVYLYERDCSLQRRHQKVVEEAPAPGLPDKVRKALGAAAVKAVKAISYSNAGTIEFIMDSRTHDFYFMEMNTRLQVEHPVTEMITGQDLVEWQLRVAAGEKLPLAQKEIPLKGHAFEVRLYAEDPASGFLPQTGKIVKFLKPDGARIDTGVAEGDVVSIHYDPMIAKIIVAGENREAAIEAMQRALADTVLAGLKTNQEFLGHVFRTPDFMAGDVDTGFIARHEHDLVPADYGRPAPEDYALAAVACMGAGNVTPQNDIWGQGDGWRLFGQASRILSLVNRGEVVRLPVTSVGREFKVGDLGVALVARDGDALTLATAQGQVTGRVVKTGNGMTVFRAGKIVDFQIHEAGAGDEGGDSRIIAPMPGLIASVLVTTGQDVKKGQALMIMEAMKMELTIRAGCDGTVADIPVRAGQQVTDGALMIEIVP